MTFAAPLWLLALLPWTALAIWLLSGHREGAQVPFLKLWPLDLPQPRARRSLRMPPPALVYLLLAILLAIFAAAGPTLRGASGWRLAVVIDRNVTLSPRLHELIRRGGELTNGMAGTADVFLVPGGRQSSVELTDWTRSVAAIQASTLPTFESLQQVVRDALRAEYDAVLLISNQSIGLDDPRLTQLSPESPIRNAGIIAVSARFDQAMVRLRNGYEAPSAELIVSSSGKSQRQPIEWAAHGGDSTVFIGLPDAGQVVSFELIVDDEIPADNRAWLVRQRGWPTVELRGNAPREVVWMIKSYGNLRPAGDEAIRVVVTDTEQTAPRDAPVVIVAAPVAEQQTGEMEVVPHPITADVDWKRIGAQVRSADAPHGWNALVTKGGVPLVAVTETPVRQVWVGFDAPLWGVSTDFVVFWSNVLDWAGASRCKWSATNGSGRMI
jgi:hypothetical protein